MRVVGETGFEPATARPPAEYSTRLSYSPNRDPRGLNPLRTGALYARVSVGSNLNLKMFEDIFKSKIEAYCLALQAH